jgi:hypothetical protein
VRAGIGQPLPEAAIEKLVYTFNVWSVIGRRSAAALRNNKTLMSNDVRMLMGRISTAALAGGQSREFSVEHLRL